MNFRFDAEDHSKTGNYPARLIARRFVGKTTMLLAFGVVALGLFPRLAEAATVNLSFVANRTSSWHSFAVDSVTGKVYLRNTYNQGATVIVYNTIADFESGTSAGTISLQNGGYWGTYIAVVNGILYGRSGSNSDAFVAAWDLASGNIVQGPTQMAGMGGLNGTDTFDWGGYSGVNLAQDQSGLYVLGATGTGWYVQKIDPALNVLASTPVGAKGQGYGFVINGFYFSSDQYDSNLITRRFELSTGLETSVDFTLSGNGPSSYWHNASYDQATDTLYLSNGTTTYGVFKIANASVVFGVDNVCGDGDLDSGEACDDGNVASGDCCDAACQYEAGGSPCATDGDVCTDDTCDGAGTCQHTPNTAPCDDGEFCTTGDTCNDGSCSGSARDCTDGDACTADTCDEPGDACVHAETPRDPASCLVGLRANFQIMDSATAAKDKLSWQWGAGESFAQSALGTPQAATTYTLCVYDKTAEVPSLAASIDIASSAVLWATKEPKGLAYKDKAGVSEGVTKAQLKTGAEGKTKVKISASGENLALPAPAGSVFFDQTPSVVVQLVNSTGTCWTSEFLAADTKANVVDSFKAQMK